MKECSVSIINNSFWKAPSFGWNAIQWLVKWKGIALRSLIESDDIAKRQL